MYQILKSMKIHLKRLLPRNLAKNPTSSRGNFTSFLINQVIKDGNFLNYLEIGSQFGYTLEAVDIPNRTGIDPNPRHNLKRLPKGVKSFNITSDEFFARVKTEN